uniref:Uncharacterized protein n=1 Tax=Loxodonta africana TaxID=9785 RepID=G3UJE2_LOXAF
ITWEIRERETTYLIPNKCKNRLVCLQHPGYNGLLGTGRFKGMGLNQ